jgi:RNA polymerase sigma-70 factor (ECF subfamily)
LVTRAQSGARERAVLDGQPCITHGSSMVGRGAHRWVAVIAPIPLGIMEAVVGNPRHTHGEPVHTWQMHEVPSQMTPEFARLLAGAQSSLYAFIVSLMAGRQEAADVLQETNLKLCREFGRYDPARPFLNWALTVARFEVMAWRTRQSRSRLILDDDVVARVAAHLETAPPSAEKELVALEACLQKLAPHHRAIVEERYRQGSTVRAIALRKGEPENAVAAMLYRIRRTLHDCITATLAQEESA